MYGPTSSRYINSPCFCHHPSNNEGYAYFPFVFVLAAKNTEDDGSYFGENLFQIGL